MHHTLENGPSVLFIVLALALVVVRQLRVEAGEAGDAAPAPGLGAEYDEYLNLGETERQAAPEDRERTVITCPGAGTAEVYWK